MRNAELLAAFDVPYDLGLDAVYVVDAERRWVVFSTELDHPNGRFTAGDLLDTRGAVLPNAALLHAAGIPRELDLGLDALHIVGDPQAISDFLTEVPLKGRDAWLEQPADLKEILKGKRLDILFSTEGTAPFLPRPQVPKFLDGDLLSAATGNVVLLNRDALPIAVPAGLPDRGVDFGLDAVSQWADQNERIHPFVFSTELNGLIPTFTDGDALLQGNGVFIPNGALINAFEPKVKDLGLDALSLPAKPPGSVCRFDKVGGMSVGPSTWDFASGYVDPHLSGDKNHPFGGWVSIRGTVPPPPQTVEHRVLMRPEGGVDSPILMPPGLGWEVLYVPPFPLPSSWVAVATDSAGWMSTSFWYNLRNNGNSDLIFVNWETPVASVPDGKYVLSLEVKEPSGATRICDELAIQIDNTQPKILLDGNNECKTFHCKDMPLDVKGKIYDKHFSNYLLRFKKLGQPLKTFGSHYYDDGPPVNDTGTIGYPALVLLGQLDIPAELGKTCEQLTEEEQGRYTVLLHAYDRSLLGAFFPPSNYVSDANPSDVDRNDRNYDWEVTNFEFYR